MFSIDGTILRKYLFLPRYHCQTPNRYSRNDFESILRDLAHVEFLLLQCTEPFQQPTTDVFERYV
jgi:hypothetical protein